eukprot:m.279514 g.279514  ORF g.279514 m.279514 type:complete len:126 (-) comp19805_c0_seq20:931-1308(-)
MWFCSVFSWTEPVCGQLILALSFCSYACSTWIGLCIVCGAGSGGVISALMACQDSTKEGDLQYTQEARAIEKTYKEAVKTVHKLSQQVVASDAQVYALQRELAELRGTAPPARPISSPTRTLSTA